MNERNHRCWCGSGQKWKKCHYPQTNPNPSKAEVAAEYYKNYKILIKTPQQIEGIRRSCRLAAKILDATCKQAIAGVSTDELNDFAHRLHLEAGATPAPLHYGHPPFPKSICTSLNEVVCHGIPGKETLKEGDILNIDVTCILDGYYGDCSKMVVVGEADEEKRRVTNVSYESLQRAVAILKPGVRVSDIGEVIEEYATSKGCSVVHQFVGHGTGVHFHENPQILHVRNNMNIPLVPGMTFTIEPMINAGVRDSVIDRKNQWTARTVDGKPSAQWEYTLLITDSGCEILTDWEKPEMQA